MTTTTTTATYYNRALNETYILKGEASALDLAKAWNLVEFVAARAGWNPIDVTKVTVK